MKQIIISLTAIPSRINSIEPVLNSLMEQTVKPDKIYINVPKEYTRFEEIMSEPIFIKENFKDKVEFFYLDYDFGPATKFIGSLINKKIDKDALLVITDDDVVKVDNWLQKLVDNHEDDKITSFVEKQLGNEIIWGYLGYIFKKDLIDPNEVISFYSKVKNQCFLVDDHWFTGFCHYKKIKIYNIPIKTYNDINKFFKHGGSKDSLVQIQGENSRADASNRCRKKIKEEFETEFPFWCCLGCCNSKVKTKTKETFANTSSTNYNVYLILFIIILLLLKYSSIQKNIILIISASLFFNCYNIKLNKTVEGFENLISNTIIQTYYNKYKIPDKVYKNIKKYAPTYHHIIYDDDECIEFLKRNYDSQIAMIFNKLQGAHKADLFRYCYLYKFGGIYLDIKTELLVPLNEVFKDNNTFTVLSAIDETIYNGIIATPPNNPIFKKLIDFIVKLVESDKPYKYLVFTIDFFTKLKEEVLEKPNPGFNKNLIDNNFNYYLLEEKCSRNAKDCYDGLDKHKMCCYIFDKDKKIFKTRYADYPW